MKFTIKGIVKKIANLPDERKFNKLKERSTAPDFTEYHELAECYHKGIGTRRNYKQALKWYIKEAEAGNADAQYSLGMRYMRGEKVVGGEKNEDEAFRWIEMAANQGHKKAQKQVDARPLTEDQLKEKLNTFVFTTVDRAVVFAKKLTSEEMREDFLHRAIDYFYSKVGIDKTIQLLNMTSDKKLRITMALKHSDVNAVQPLLNEIKKNAKKQADWQLLVATTYEELGNMDEAWNYYNLLAHNKISPNIEPLLAFAKHRGAQLEQDKDYARAQEILKPVFDIDKQQHIDFLRRWSQYLIDNKEYLEAREKLMQLEQLGENVTDDNKQLDSLMRSEFGNSYELRLEIEDTHNPKKLIALKDKATEVGVEDILEEAIKNAIKDKILSCKNVEELKPYEELAEEYDLDFDYENQFYDLGGYLEDNLKEATDLEEIAGLEEKAYKYDYKDKFLKCLDNEAWVWGMDAEILEDINECYPLFHKQDSKRILINKFKNYLYAEGFDDHNFEYDNVRKDLSIEDIHQILCIKFYGYVKDEDIEEALKVYLSKDFEDPGDAYLILEQEFSEMEISEVAEYAVKYADESDPDFFGYDLGELYYVYAQETEDDDMEEAVDYYKKASKKYGYEDARIRLEELYED